ncbi:outer membrane lipoprotein-sorting protein [Denitromonas iodatirespirans]|uniref:Outer membrane lipoprotein-sorting protein n=1 Tax=Denitromonas iodatirespirans TaxID=2795389 RepID=A0A944H8N9_DENI1|nr:outer membrane lipoprotein-sorting protein [Denitromonas iodatirespirans]MBT0962409.1 outer membrane lipoprotein-sorting protein [Denitromonas iodatirespirans]
MLALILASASPAARSADTFVADEAGLALMRQSEQQTKSRTERSVYRMILEAADGSVVQERRMSLYFRRADEDGAPVERTLIRFERPASLQGTGLLVVDRGESANDLWLYMPANRRLRRLAGAEKSNWFLGTEFTHEDFEDYKIEHYAFSAPRDAPCGALQCRVVEARPSTALEQDASGYTGKTYWLEAQSLYPVLIEYHAKGGIKGKRLETRGLEKLGDYWRPSEYEMRNLDNGQVTRMLIESRQLDLDLDVEYTTKRFLRGG